jgi:hypothetical protein
MRIVRIYIDTCVFYPYLMRIVRIYFHICIYCINEVHLVIVSQLGQILLALGPMVVDGPLRLQPPRPYAILIAFDPDSFRRGIRSARSGS